MMCTNHTTYAVTDVFQGYGRGGTPVFTGVFEPVARVTLYLTDENGLGTCFWSSLDYLCIADRFRQYIT